MRVLLINPPSPQRKHYFMSPPLGLMYLASILRAKGHKTKILDLFSFNENYKKLSEIFKKKLFDIVGITGMSFQHNTILKISSLIKKINSEIKIILGGAHASALPFFLLKNENIDFLLRGEAEFSLPALLNVIDNPREWQNIPGLCYKTNEKIKISPPEIVKNIDLIPIPAWDLINFKKYSGSPHGFFYKKEPIGQIITSRGCPYACTFCAAHIIHSKKWRPHSPARVLSEIDYLVNELGIQEIHIEDDNFSVNLQRAKTIFKGIIKKKYNLSIAFPNGIRIDRIDEELLKLMKSAGVYSLTFGIESGSPRILQRVKKNLSLNFLEKQLKKIKKFGFTTHGFFIIGFPYEKIEDIEETINFSLKINLDAAFFGTYVPLPGSLDFHELEEKGKIDLEKMNWDQMFSLKAQNNSHYLSPQEIEHFQHLATRKFYLRPKIFFKTLGRIQGYKHFFSLIKRLMAVF